MFITLLLVIIIILYKDDVNSIIRTIQKRDEDVIKTEGKDKVFDVSEGNFQEESLKESQSEFIKVKEELDKLKIEKELIELEKEKLEKENNFYKSESNLKKALIDSKKG